MGETSRAKRTWEGGYIIADARGHDTFYIRKQFDGRRYDLSTGCHTRRAAIKQLERFEANPSGYQRQGEAPAKPLPLDEELAAEFLSWCRDVKGNSQGWLRKQRVYVSWWAGQLKGCNLRRLTLADDIKPALKKASATGHRIATLKALYSWLRKEKHLLTVAEDPTFQTLSVPQAKPAQWKKPKAILRNHYLLAREQLAPNWRDPLDLQAGTGWHVTEVQRFAEGGSAEPVPRGSARGVAGVLVCPQTKGGEMLRTAVSAGVFEAGKRLLERGSLSIEKYGLAVKGACRAARIPAFTPGRFRHSVATWAINNGADPASVAAFLNHKSPRTTMRFYATHATPKKVPTLV